MIAHNTKGTLYVDSVFVCLSVNCMKFKYILISTTYVNSFNVYVFVCLWYKIIRRLHSNTSVWYILTELTPHVDKVHVNVLFHTRNSMLKQKAYSKGFFNDGLPKYIWSFQSNLCIWKHRTYFWKHAVSNKPTK